MNISRKTLSAQELVFYRRVLAGNRLELTQVWFDVGVLEPYRTKETYKLFRSDTLGMLQGPRWRLDFGISKDETLVHLAMDALRDQLPESEWEHWLAHLHSPPVSQTYLISRLSSPGCLDDGEIRAWK